MNKCLLHKGNTESVITIFVSFLESINWQSFITGDFSFNSAFGSNMNESIVFLQEPRKYMPSQIQLGTKQYLHKF